MVQTEADRLIQPIARGTYTLLNNRGTLLVEDWNRIDHVCKHRLPGSVTGLRCGQHLYYQYYPSSRCTRIFVVLIRNFSLINSTVLYNIGVTSWFLLSFAKKPTKFWALRVWEYWLLAFHHRYRSTVWPKIFKKGHSCPKYRVDSLVSPLLIQLNKKILKPHFPQFIL